MADMIPIPMTAAARDALVAAIVLCIMYAIIVGLRVIGRLRWGILGLDDILSVAACVSPFVFCIFHHGLVFFFFCPD